MNPVHQYKPRNFMIISLRSCCFVLFFAMVSVSMATVSSTSIAGADSSGSTFKDEFSELDGSKRQIPKLEFNTRVTEAISKAKSAYDAGVTAILKADTAAAIRQLERALSALQKLGNEPNIELNRDYTRLLSVVREDYEFYTQSLSDLSDQSPEPYVSHRVADESVRTHHTDAVTGSATRPLLKPLSKLTIDMTVNEEVEKSIAFLTVDAGRPFMKRWLERSGRWFPTLRRIAREEGMPEEIIYLAMMESGLNPNAQSWAKAVGMWQFIASTGDMYGLQITPWIDERRDVEKSTRAAMRFLKDLYNDFGDWHLALAAYNCGPGCVRRAKRKAGLPDGNFWEIRDELPRETRNYVPRYIATSLTTMSPEQYRFPFDSLTFHLPYQYDVFAVTEPTNLSALAKCAGISVDSLKALNPELLRSCTPPNMTYKLKIPLGLRDTVTHAFALLTPEEKQPWVNHLVKRKETLASIADAYGVPLKDLANINGITGYKSRLRAGTSLRIPIISGTAAPETVPVTPSAPSAAIASNPQSVTPKAKSETATVKSTPVTQFHVVQAGESLSRIATAYSTTVADLRNWNNMSDRHETILPGDTILVLKPLANQTIRVEQIPESKVIRHKVGRGETLTSIADKYATTIDKLRSRNKLSERSVLKHGSVLFVETNVITSRAKTQASEKPRARASYTVLRGDTLDEISEKTGISISALRKLNPSIKRSDIIRVGQRLRLQ